MTPVNNLAYNYGGVTIFATRTVYRPDVYAASLGHSKHTHVKYSHGKLIQHTVLATVNFRHFCLRR